MTLRVERMVRMGWVMALTVALAGCGSDGAGKAASDVGQGTGVADVGGDASRDSGSLGHGGSDVRGIEVDEEPVDAGSNAGGAGDAADAGDAGGWAGGSGDAGPAGDVGDGIGEDADADVSGTPVDPYAGRPLGQCVQDADCPVGPAGASCSGRLPGGSCNPGCGTDAHCPDGAVCNDFGACALACSGEGDCPPGLTCGSNGQCRAMACVDGACPVPMYGCNSSNRCERLACTFDEECPADTQCMGGLCVEGRLLRGR